MHVTVFNYDIGGVAEQSNNKPADEGMNPARKSSDDLKVRLYGGTDFRI